METLNSASILGAYSFGAGSDFSFDPTIPEIKLKSQASQNSAESGVCLAQFGQFLCSGLGLAANNRSASRLFVSVLPAVYDLKKVPNGFRAIQAARMSVTANANK
jgi:hypothetical protein